MSLLRFLFGTLSTGSSAPPIGGIGPTLFVEVELAGVASGWTNLASDVLRPYGVRITRGIRGSGPTDRVASTGTAKFVLNNSDRNSGAKLGYYSPYHANKRTGWALGINCQIRLVDPSDGSNHVMFSGRIDAIDPAPGIKAERTVSVTATDWIDEAARWALTPAVGEQVGKRADEILTAILAQMPRQPTTTLFDIGSDAYQYALDTRSIAQQAALTEFAKLAASEFGLIYVTGNGSLRFEDRHRRLMDTSTDWTIPDTALQDLRLPSTRAEIINTVRVVTHRKPVDPAPTTAVYEQTGAIEVPGSGGTKTIEGSYRDPETGDAIGATGILPQVAGVDYVANINPDGTGADITADFTVAVTAGPATVKFVITNNNFFTGSLTVNRLFGRGIYDRGTTTFTATNPTSIATNGENVVTIDMPYQDKADVGQGAADYTLAKYGAAFAQARRIRVFGTTNPLLLQIETRDISDRLSISETATGLSSAFFINGLDILVTPTGHVQADYTLAPAADPFSGMYWVLGTSTLGTDTTPAPF